MHHSRRLSCLLCFVPFVASIGCDAGAEDSATFAVRDSAGMAVVESSAPLWDEGEGWTIDPEPEVTIGEVDGGEEYLLDDVQTVRRFRDGRIAVLDRGVQTVRVYDPEGRHLFDAGGPGEGPAEFTSAHFMALVGDTIVVYEAAPPSLTWFDDTGGFLRTAPLPSEGEGAPPFGVAFGFLDGGSVVTAAAGRQGYTPGRDRERTAIWRLDPAGQADSLAEIRTEEVIVHTDNSWNNLTFGRTTYFAASDSHMYLAPSGRYSIQVLNPQGEVVRIIRRDVEPRPVVPGDVRRWAEQMMALLGQPPESADRVEANTRRAGTANVMPVYRMITVDAADDLWVEDWDDVGIEQGAFSVFRPDGAWLGRVELPPGLPWRRALGSSVTPLSIGEDYVLGTWIGELGTQQVRLYRIRKE